MAQTPTTKRTAGAFDIRSIIGLLLGIYGVIVLLLGIFHATDEELAKADDLNVNLMTGIILVLVSAGFFAWVKIRPLVVPDDFVEEDEAAKDDPKS